jgi:hypothetical protein
MSSGFVFEGLTLEDFKPFRRPFIQEMNDRFASFREEHGLGETWTLSELYGASQTLFRQFTDKHSYFSLYDDLDMFYLMMSKGIGCTQLLESLAIDDQFSFKNIEHHFYASGIASVVSRLPFESKDRVRQAVTQLFNAFDESGVYQTEHPEFYKLRQVFKYQLYHELRNHPWDISHYNVWLPMEQLKNLTRCDGELEEALASESINTLLTLCEQFTPERTTHPLNTSGFPVNLTAREKVLKILIEVMVYDKAALMHLNDQPVQVTLNVLQASARMLAEHFVSAIEKVDEVASQMVINALALFDGPWNQHRSPDQIWGIQRGGEPRSLLEQWVLAGPLQAFRVESDFNFDNSPVFHSTFEWLKHLHGDFPLEAFLGSYLAWTPSLRDLADSQNIVGLEHHIDTLPDSPFLYFRESIRGENNWCRVPAMLRSARLLQDFDLSQQQADRTARLSNHSIKPRTLAEETLLLNMLMERSSPSPALVKACRISVDCLKTKLDDLSDDLKAEVLAIDLGF